MRKTSVHAAVAVAGAASAALSAAIDNQNLHHMGRTRYPTGWSSSANDFHPRLNRHNFQPHLHAREIARNQRRSPTAA